jgi:excisionase family DNA binding protein
MSKARFYTVAEVAEITGFSERQVRRWIAAGELAAHRFRRALRIAEADLTLFLASRRAV